MYVRALNEVEHILLKVNLTKTPVLNIILEISDIRIKSD